MKYSKIREEKHCRATLVALLAESLGWGISPETLRTQNDAEGFKFSIREGSEASEWCSIYQNYNLPPEEFDRALAEALEAELGC